MKPFNLEEYLANPNKKIVTRAGFPVRIICINRKDDDYPIIALIQNSTDNHENIYHFTINGKYINSGNSAIDLFFVTQNKEKWINVYGNSDGKRWCEKYFYDTEDEAKISAFKSLRIATIKVKYEE